MKRPVVLRPLLEALDELEREWLLRQRCYERWVAEKRISATDATDRLQRQESAIYHLTKFAESSEAVRNSVLDNTSEVV